MLSSSRLRFPYFFLKLLPNIKDDRALVASFDHTHAAALKVRLSKIGVVSAGLGAGLVDSTSVVFLDEGAGWGMKNLCAII